MRGRRVVSFGERVEGERGMRRNRDCIIWVVKIDDEEFVLKEIG
jgi:hypothetical protein